MANLIRKWEKVMAVGCKHGEFVHPLIHKQVLKFEASYKPKYRFELGDILDTTAFRHGAKGTKDETADVGADFLSGVRWLEQYRPTHIAWGNHDARLVELADAPNGIVAHCASTLWHDLQDAAAKIKAKTVPYDFHKGWFELGGYYWGHGYWYNEQSVRDHAEFLGGPCCIAHLHRAYQENGRTRRFSPSFCVGAMADAEKLKYSRRRRATARHGHGLVFGEVCGNESRLWLARSENGQPLHFPFAI